MLVNIYSKIFVYFLSGSLAYSDELCYNTTMTDYELMRLSETVDEDAYEREDFDPPAKSQKQIYDDFYDDVKQPSRYIKEDW